jgi:hypothetical protein
MPPITVAIWPISSMRPSSPSRADFASRVVHLSDGGGRLLGDLLHGVGAFSDPPDLSAHLVHRGGRVLQGLLEIRRAVRHLIDRRAHLRGGRRGLLVVARELLELGVDAADRGVDVREQGGGFLDGGLLVLRALVDLGHGLGDLLGQTLKIPGEAARR